MEIRNDTDFSVIEETDDYVVVDKPAPLLVHPTQANGPLTMYDGLVGLLAYDIANGGQVSIINRLDRETSGVVLVAKRAESARAFSILMERRKFSKGYEALVHGWPEEDVFVAEGAILRKGEVVESPIWVKQMVHPEGNPCETHFRVVERFEGQGGRRFSVVEARPVTGRMHQIRVHLAEAGYPIVGDKIYGEDETCYLDFIETGWTEALEERLLIPRQALHACWLEVEWEGRRLSWKSPRGVRDLGFDL